MDTRRRPPRGLSPLPFLVVLLLLALAQLLAAGTAGATVPPGHVLWDPPIFYATNPNSDEFSDLARCPSGNVVAVGVRNELMGGSGDPLICEYNAAGFLQWASNPVDFPNLDYDWLDSVAVDGHGNVVAAGVTRTASGGLDVLVVRYDRAATTHPDWTVSFDGGAHVSDSACDVVVDAAGNAYVVASVTTAVGWLTDNTVAFRIYKLRASDGAVLWTKTYKGPSGTRQATPRACAIDSHRNLYVTGYVTNADDKNRMATIKVSPGGKLLWSRPYLGVSKEAYATRIARGRDGSIYVLGATYRKATSFDPTLVKYTPAGAKQWAVRYDVGKGQNESLGGLAIDRHGNLFAGGSSGGTGNDDGRGYLVKWTTTGARRWARRFDAATMSAFTCVLADGAGGAYVAGDVTPLGGNAECMTVHYRPNGTVLWHTVTAGPNGADRFNALAFLGSSGVCSAGAFTSATGYTDAIFLGYQK